MLAIEFYDCVVAVHVMAIVIAFGVTFAYPLMGPFIGQNAPQATAAFHRLQERIGNLLITPFATVALATGIYLAADHDLMGKVWVTVPLVILLLQFALGGAFFAPSSRKLADLAESEPGGPAYLALLGRVKNVGLFADVTILVAIFFMVAKPGGY